jgi:hypothetical protein
MTTDSHEMLMDPLVDLSGVPDEVLKDYATIISEEDEPDPDAAFMRRLEAIYRMHDPGRGRPGRDFYATPNNIHAEVLRRQGKEVPLRHGQVYDWNGVTFVVKRVSRDPYKPWADIACTGPGGASWKKRQPLPLPAGSKLIGWQRG